MRSSSFFYIVGGAKKEHLEVARKKTVTNLEILGGNGYHPMTTVLTAVMSAYPVSMCVCRPCILSSVPAASWAPTDSGSHELVGYCVALNTNLPEGEAHRSRASAAQGRMYENKWFPIGWLLFSEERKFHKLVCAKQATRLYRGGRNLCGPSWAHATWRQQRVGAGSHREESVPSLISAVIVFNSSEGQ